MPPRKSATQASRAISHPDGDPHLGGSDEEVKKKKISQNGAARRGGKLQTYGKRGRPPKVIKSISLPGKLYLESPQGESSPRTSRPKPTPIVKRKRSPSLLIHSSPLMNEGGGSVLVGVEESDTQTRANDDEPLFLYTNFPDPIRKRAKMSHNSSEVDELSDFSSSHSAGPGSPDSEVEILAFTPALLTHSEPADSVSTTQVSHGSRHIEEPTWTSQNLGSYVWVLIEPTVVRVVDPNKDQSQDEYRIWWPGKITSPYPTEIPLRVKLFGQNDVVIHEPSEANIVSKYDSLGRWRYQSPIFVSSPLLQTPSSSRKKLGNECEVLEINRREELEGRWKNAVIQMKQAEEAEQDSDYLPDVGEMSSWATSGLSLSQAKRAEVDDRVKKKGKQKRIEVSEEDVLEHSDWKPPSPDDTLQIPGELILGRENPGSGASAIHHMNHWPAKILAYKPPKHPKQQPKYLVKWLDGTEGEILRSCFYTVDEEGFAVCKLGPFESSIVEVENDDENESLESSKARWDFSRRSPSPEVNGPLPSIEEFRKLSIRVRFSYTKPVLKAILNKEYEPAMEFHRLFMAGGPKRSRLLEYSSRRGHMDLEEVSELTNYLKEWCLRPSTTNVVYTDNQGNDVQDGINEQDKERKLSEIPKHDMRISADLDEGNGPSSTFTMEAVPSSPEEMPPSSSFPVERGNSLVTGSSPPKLLSVAERGMATHIVSSGISDVPDRTISQDRLPRQQGCDEYEALTDLDKLNYCTAILLPESIRQILLWQNGIRTSFELLSTDKEQDLYEKGDDLLNETEWVFNVKRMRQRAEEVLKRNGAGKRRTQPVDYRQ